MPWLSLIVFLASFILSKKKGASTGKAALIAGAAGLATYALVDPANSDNYFGVTTGATVTDENAGSPTSSETATGTISPTNWADVGKTTVTTAKDVITNPNSAGTIAAAGAATGSGIFSSSNLPWLLGGLGLILLLRK